MIWKCDLSFSIAQQQQQVEEEEDSLARRFEFARFLPQPKWPRENTKPEARPRVSLLFQFFLFPPLHRQFSLSMNQLDFTAANLNNFPTLHPSKAIFQRRSVWPVPEEDWPMC